MNGLLDIIPINISKLTFITVSSFDSHDPLVKIFLVLIMRIKTGLIKIFEMNFIMRIKGFFVMRIKTGSKIFPLFLSCFI